MENESQITGANSKITTKESKSINTISSEIINKHKARGRPKKELDTKKNIQSEGMGVASDSKANSTPIDKELIISAINSLCETVDGIFTRKVYKTAFLVTEDKTSSQELALDAGMKVTEKELISGLGANVMEKHAILGQYAPEVLLGVTLCGYSVRMGLAISKLNHMAEEKRASLKLAKNATKPQSNQTID